MSSSPPSAAYLEDNQCSVVFATIVFGFLTNYCRDVLETGRSVLKMLPENFMFGKFTTSFNYSSERVQTRNECNRLVFVMLDVDRLAKIVNEMLEIVGDKKRFRSLISDVFPKNNETSYLARRHLDTIYHYLMTPFANNGTDTSRLEKRKFYTDSWIRAIDRSSTDLIEIIMKVPTITRAQLLLHALKTNWKFVLDTATSKELRMLMSDACEYNPRPLRKIIELNHEYLATERKTLLIRCHDTPEMLAISDYALTLDVYLRHATSRGQFVSGRKAIRQWNDEVRAKRISKTLAMIVSVESATNFCTDLAKIITSYVRPRMD